MRPLYYLNLFCTTTRLFRTPPLPSGLSRPHMSTGCLNPIGSPTEVFPSCARHSEFLRRTMKEKKREQVASGNRYPYPRTLFIALSNNYHSFGDFLCRIQNLHRAQVNARLHSGDLPSPSTSAPPPPTPRVDLVSVVRKFLVTLRVFLHVMPKVQRR